MEAEYKKSSQPVQNIYFEPCCFISKVVFTMDISQRSTAAFKISQDPLEWST